MCCRRMKSWPGAVDNTQLTATLTVDASRMLTAVVASEPDRRIGWRPQMVRAPDGMAEMGGHGPREQLSPWPA